MIRKVYLKERKMGRSRVVDVLKEKKRSSAKSDSLFGLKPGFGFLSQAQVIVAKKNKPIDETSSIDAQIHVIGGSSKVEDVVAEVFGEIGSTSHHWQKKYFESRSQDILHLQLKCGPVWMVRSHGRTLPEAHAGQGFYDAYGHLRSLMGSLSGTLKDQTHIKHLAIKFHGCHDAEINGALLGLEIGAYRFQTIMKALDQGAPFKISLLGVHESHVSWARAMGQSMNIARHLVNLDAATLNPKTYAQFSAGWFKRFDTVTVEIWDSDKVKKERMNLLYAVGQAGVEKSHMVILRYRPKAKPRFKKPIAIVGKGVTFDTGGIDLKPASGMRLMKKDMGGSASAVGILNWLVESQSDVPCDVYLGLAENAVSSRAFHPGDVITARNRTTVEIHNTDAEGRLVMADVFDVAQDFEPSLLIDLATLTGAMRVAVGVDIAGYFSNTDRLAAIADAASQEACDPCWRMPLWDGYKGQLKSHVADMANASDSGFAGAITAALFLQRFVRPKQKWLHFDLYCWADRPHSGLSEVGGSGQGVQLISQFLERLKPSDL
jgi:leucyl aminopeptidase